MPIHHIPCCHRSKPAVPRLLRIMVTAIFGAGAALGVAEETKPVKVTYVTSIPNARHPEPVYWFWTNDTLKDRRYLQDVREIAGKSKFDFLMMTDRTAGQGSVFHDTKRMHDVFAEVVNEAHARGLKVGLQLWAEGYPKVTKENAVACVTEGEVVLDREGRAGYSTTSRWVQEGGGDATCGKHEPIVSEPLKAFAFRKAGDGAYEPGSLVELPASALTVTQSAPDGLNLKIDGTAKLAGCTVYVLVAHYIQFPDLFAGVMAEHFTHTLRQYRDIAFDGTGIDEFGWMMLKSEQPDKTPFRDRYYGMTFAKEFARLKGRPLETELFRMRYAPAGESTQRIRAINDYFEVMRQAPQRIERTFHDLSKELFGPKTFAGIHNTYHNSLDGDEVWRTGLNWWRVPREYGQSDEDISLPVRMGLLVNATEPVTYDQFYSPDVGRYTAKVMLEARYNGRTHYHAWNDKGQWGRDMGADDVLAVINPLEEKIRLLNQFDPAAPRLPILVIFGMPALLNWYPDVAARSRWDINGQLGIEEKAKAIWQAGYPCALVPSDLIDVGQIALDANDHPVIHGHRFDSIVYLYPQYAKEATLQFLERYVRQGGRLMLEGKATNGFDGNDITTRFEKLAALATVRGFNMTNIAQLGVKANPLADGAYMEDGAVVFTDFNSWKSGTPKPFHVALGGHDFSGSYVGVCALKVDSGGSMRKFACGGFTELRRDGRVMYSLPQPADILIRPRSDGAYEATVVRPAGSVPEDK